MSDKDKKTKKRKKKKKPSYMEQALKAARQHLPGWAYAMLHHATRPRASKSRWAPTAAEKMLMKQRLTAAESVSLKKRVAKWAQNGIKFDPILADSDTMPEAVKAKHAVYKGFINGEPEGGVHAHGLDRGNSKTREDGGHVHLFVLPGGEWVITEEDGFHAHRIEGMANTTEATTSAHSHRVFLPSLEGPVSAETMLDGEHAHQLMVETTTFDGVHQHTLRLADGTEIKSVTPNEFAEMFEFTKEPTMPIFSAREIAGSMMRARFLEEMLEAQAQDTSLAVAETMLPFEHGDEIFKTKGEMTVGIAKAMMAGKPFLFTKDNAEYEIPLGFDAVMEVNEDRELTLGTPDGITSGIKAETDLQIEPGDLLNVRIVDGKVDVRGFSGADEPTQIAYAQELEETFKSFEQSMQMVPFEENPDAKLVFVVNSPRPVEVARQQLLVGGDGVVFKEQYLKPLSLERSEVAVGCVMPMTVGDEYNPEDWEVWINKQLEQYPKAKIVALGRVAKQVLGESADFVLPHPAAVRRHGDSGEVGRKLKKIVKALDTEGISTEDKSDPARTDSKSRAADDSTGGDGIRKIRIAKAEGEKQVVYGAVLDPYQVDAHNDWIPAAVIEETAHGFVADSRVIGRQHTALAKAELVESWIEAYPSSEDYQAAMKNLPHKAYKRQFGEDEITSGTWMVGVKLGDEEWAAYKNGEITGFSIGALTFKTAIDSDAMPDVQFVDLVP